MQSNQKKEQMIFNFYKFTFQSVRFNHINIFVQLQFFVALLVLYLAFNLYNQFMIIEREDHRRQRQKVYRQELLNQIQSKPGKNRNNNIGINEDFSLIKNIEQQQQNRKNKQKMYYAELRSHLQEQQARKKRQKQQQKRRQLQEDQKIRKQNEMLNKRYQEQIRRQQTKGKASLANNNPTIQESPLARQNEDQIQFDYQKQPYIPKKFETTPDIIDNMNTEENYYNRLQPAYEQNKQFIPRHYSGKIQNEAFNFVSLPKINRKYYYKEILDTKKNLEHETGLLSELNQVLSRERYRDNGKKYGLQQLKLLNQLLENKQSNYEKDRFTKLRAGSQKSELKRIVTQEDTQMDKWYRL